MLLLNGALVLLASFLLTPSVAQGEPCVLPQFLHDGQCVETCPQTELTLTFGNTAVDPPQCEPPQQVQCFTASSTTIGSGCQGPSFTAVSIEACCVLSAGQFYRQTSGDPCQPCIVFGWLNGSELLTEERGDVTILQVGFIKGALFEEFLQIDRRRELRFLISVTEGTAREGANFDFTVPSGSRSAAIDNATIPASIQTLIRVDIIALERPEDFTLTLIGANAAAIAVLNAAAPNTFAIPSIQVTIEDREEALLQFTESEYSSIERDEVIHPSVQLLTNIATELTVVAIPVNYTFVNDSESPRTDILAVIPNVPGYNPDRPFNATSFPFEDRDFNTAEVGITFPAGNTGIQRIDIGIVDDSINEVEQLFVIFLQVVDAVDPSRVNLQSGRFATLGRILDDDPLIIGFEQSSYTCLEAEVFGQLTIIPIIKGNNQRSEITFSLTADIITGSGAEAANIDQTDDNRDIIAGLFQERIFIPDLQSIEFRFELVNDDEPESREVFQVELSLQESGLNINLGGMLNDGSALFASTQFFIIDDDATVTIGWEEEFTSVNENHGILELCVLVLSITGSNVNATFSPFISITLAANTIRGTAADPVDYEQLLERRGDLFFVDITADNDRSCIEVVINDDNLLEATESFTVQVVPDSFNHPDGLPTSFFLVPDLTVVEIIDNDLPTVTFTSRNYEVSENNGTATVCVRKDLEVVGSFDVDITSRETVPRQAEGSVDPNTADFQIVTRTLTFTGDQQVACTGIPITDDTKDESQEDFEVVLEAPSNVIEGDPSVAIVTIVDDDVTSIEFDSPNYTVNEDNGTVTVCLTTNRGTATALVVDVVASVKPSSSNPASTADFVPATQTITFPGSTTVSRVCTSFQITNDTIALEGNEQFRVDFMAPAGTQTGVIDTACVTIIDDDGTVVTVQFTQPENTVGEADGMLVLTVDKRGENTIPLQVTITVNSMSATAGEDFTAPARTLTLPPGGDQQLQTLTVQIIDDSVAEGMEGFSVELRVRRGDTEVSLGEISTTTVTIIDNDGIAIGFTQAQYLESEGAGGVPVTVQMLSGRLETTITVRMYTVNGVALTPEDYLAIDMTLTFSSLMTMYTTEVEIVNDNFLETNEHFFVRLEIVSSEVPVSILRNQTRIIITSDDQCPRAGVPVSENPLLSTDPLAIYCVNVCYRKFRRGRLCP